MAPKNIILIPWLVIGVVWLVGALATKRTARSQSLGSRLLHIAIGEVAIVVGFIPVRLGSLDHVFLPNSPVVNYLGFFLAVAGAGVAIWARIYLGGNWSGLATVKEHHTLVTRGPYGLVRHPIYSGFLLAVLGTVIYLRELRGLAGLGLILMLFVLKMRIEEKFMVQEFGSQYADYRRRVKALIPLVY